MNADSKGELRHGREAHRRRAWNSAFQALTSADEQADLDVGDLERLAEAAYLVGRDEVYLRILERLHHAHLEAGDVAAAARWAFWSGLELMLRGEGARASGNFARARRLIEGRDCVEQGYLLLATVEQRLAEEDAAGAHDAAASAAAIGERYGDEDLVACARHLQGKALLLAGSYDAGFTLLDEAMVAVTAGELSPIVTGLVYCNVIEACRHNYALDRAREWTTALARWCEGQPQMVAFTTACLIHRAEVLRLHGAWPDAIAEARRACERFAGDPDVRPPAAAFYQQAEVYRLQGQFDAAEEAFRLASRGGKEPHPGLALLRLAQGRTDAAAAAIGRALAATTDRLRRTALLPACIEIMIEAGHLREAEAASDELEAIAAEHGSVALNAMAAQGRGAVALAAGRPMDASVSLRSAHQSWLQLDAPYAAARVRLLMGIAARQVSDEEGARLELDAARAVFEQLGAAPDVARVDALSPRPHLAGGLTARELEVLRLVATGRTNKAIAAELFLSDRTVERHVSNILAKLSVSSRAAATAYAYRQNLL